MFAREHRACRKESRRCQCNEFGHTAKLNAPAALVVRNLRATPTRLQVRHRAVKVIAIKGKLVRPCRHVIVSGGCAATSASESGKNQPPAARVVRLQPKLVARLETSSEPLELIATRKSVFLPRQGSEVSCL